MFPERNIEEACLELANHLIVLCGIEAPRVSSLLDINSNLFVLLFKNIFKVKIPELISKPESSEDAAHNVQVVIDTLSLDIINISLSHITGEDVVSKNAYAIHNLLEIFEGYLLYLSSEYLADEHYRKGFSDANDESDKYTVSPAVQYSTEHEKSNSSLFSVVKCPLCGYEINENSSDKKADGGPVDFAKCKHSVDYVDVDKSGLLLINAKHTHVKMPYTMLPSQPVQENELEATANQVSSDRSYCSFSVPVVPLLKANCLKPEFARIGVREEIRKECLHYDQNQSHMELQVPQKESMSSLASRSFKHLNCEFCWSSALPQKKTECNLQKEKSLSQSLLDVMRDQEKLVDDFKSHQIQHRRKSRSLEDLKTLRSVIHVPSVSPNKLNRHIEKIAKFQSPARRDAHELHEKVEVLFYKNLEAKLKDQLLEVQKEKIISSQTGNALKVAIKKSGKKKKTIVHKKSVLIPKHLQSKSRIASLRRERSPNAQLSHKHYGIIKNTDEKNGKTAFTSELQKEFPSVYLSPSAITRATKQYEQHLLKLRKNLRDTLQKKSQICLQKEEAEKRQRILFNILQKEAVHNQQLKNVRNQQNIQKKVRSAIQESRHQSALVKQYYDDFHTHMKKRVQQREAKEELVLQHVFEENLRLHKAQIDEMRKQVQERQKKEAQHHKTYLDSLENYYPSQFSLLAESLAIEKKDLQERAKAQARVLKQMKQDFRHRLEQEVRCLQDQVAEKDLHFRDMDAERYKKYLNHKFKVPCTI